MKLTYVDERTCEMTLSLEALQDLLGLPYPGLKISAKQPIIDPVTHSITFQVEGTMIPPRGPIEAGDKKLSLKLEYHQPINRHPHVIKFV